MSGVNHFRRRRLMMSIRTYPPVFWIAVTANHSAKAALRW